jgi:WD40 repeat protein
MSALSLMDGQSFNNISSNVNEPPVMIKTDINDDWRKYSVLRYQQSTTMKEDDLSNKKWQESKPIYKHDQEFMQITKEQALNYNSIAFSNDGQLLAVGSVGGNITIWNVTSRTEILTLSGHNNEITDIDFSPDSKSLTSGSADGTARLWNLTTGTELRSLINSTPSFVWSVAYSSNGEKLAAGYGLPDNGIRLWNATGGPEISTLSGHVSNVYSIDFSPNDQLLASVSADEVVKLWDVASGTELYNLTSHDEEVLEVVFSTDGQLLASGGLSSGRNIIKLWDVTNGAELRTLDGHDGNITSIAFSSDGLTLASCYMDGIVKIWDVTTGSWLNTLTTGSEQLSCVIFSPDDQLLASGTDVQSIKIWDRILNDRDGDDIPDSWESIHDLDNLTYLDGIMDPDGDELNNLQEYQFGTDPHQPDTDNDLMLDGYEYFNGLNGTIDDADDDTDADLIPNIYEFQNGLNANSDDANDDNDGDGLTNLVEYYLGTRADLNDTDYDGFPDGIERDLGFDPRTASSTPLFLVVPAFLLICLGIIIIIAVGRIKQLSRRRELALQYAAPDYSTVRKIQAGNFPDYKTYKQARSVGAKKMEQLELVQQYRASDYGTAMQMQLDEFIEILRTLGRFQSRWSFSIVAERLSVPETKVSSILRRLVNLKKIDGKIDMKNKQFLSSWPTEDELKRVRELITQIRENIPVPITRIAEKTGMDENRCERVIKQLTGASQVGEYLEIEGVFIKSDTTMEAIDKLLDQYADWEKTKKGKE